MARKKKLKVEDVIPELSLFIEDSVDFMSSEFEDDWELAEAYYAGKTRMPSTVGRSNVVKTEVRDAIRNTMPSIMRTLLQARKIVEYIPNSVTVAPWVEQQAEYVTQLFWESDGYSQIYNCVLDAAKLKIGPVKTYYIEDPDPVYFKTTKVTQQQIEELLAAPDISIEDIVERDEDGPITLYDVEGYQEFPDGRIYIESINPAEFFINRNATSIQNAIEEGVHGHRRSITVGAAIEMGLDFPNWVELDDEDPEQDEFEESTYYRRGYQKRNEQDYTSEDTLKHRFLLTEAYVTYDLNNTGRPQLYKFFLGGTSYKYIDHEEVEDSEFDLVQIDPIPHSAVGRSLADLLINEQDTNTSLLRATIDNAHASNNPRLAADPLKTNFDDLRSQRIGAHIRSKSDSPIQTVAIPFTGGQLLPLLQYLDMDTQNKVGVTKAAQGLDPDAMQSTDKNAVINTIQTSQGQVELMVRNIVETGLIPIFKKLLKLSARHMPAVQLMRTKGNLIPVSISTFDPNLIAIPNVGLGTASPMMKKQALMFVLQQQKEFMQTMGMNNPFTSYTQIYNTLEDLAELDGIMNVSRYFKMVTPEVEKRLAQAQQAAAAKQQKEGPVDPSKALVAIEQVKAGVKEKEILSDQIMEERKLAQKAFEAQMKADLERDKLAQDRVIEFTKLGQEQANAKREEKLKKEQEETKPDESRNKSNAAGSDSA